MGLPFAKVVQYPGPGAKRRCRHADVAAQRATRADRDGATASTRIETDTVRFGTDPYPVIPRKRRGDGH
jgi:hypothetical protein